MPDHASHAPFFVVGSGRSGTTLLRLMLNAHPRLHVPRESWFLIDLMRALPLEDPLTREQAEQACALIAANAYWADFGVETERLRATVGALSAPTLRQVAEAPFLLSAERAGKPRWGDKTPRYVSFIEPLARLFPDAKFIHIVRDARDVCLSFRKRGWRGGGFPEQVRFWARQVGGGVAAGRPLGAARYLEIAYEDLVLSSRATLERVCEFLGEAFDERMLGFYETAQKEIPPGHEWLHDRLVRPPQASDVHRWKREMSSVQVMIVEALAGEVMDRVGQVRHYRGLRRLPVALVSLYPKISGAMARLGIPRPPLRRWLGIADVTPLAARLARSREAARAARSGDS